MAAKKYRKNKKHNYRPLIALGAVLLILFAAVLVAWQGNFAQLFNPSATKATQGASLPAGHTPPVTSSPANATPTPSPLPTQSPKVSVRLAGDILLHDTSRNSAKLADGSFDFNPYFELVKESLQADLSICNIESPVDAQGNDNGLKGYPRFNIPRAIIPALQNAGFNMAVTNNNHALDQGYKGLVNTLAALRDNKMDSFGTYDSKEAFNTHKIVDVKGMKIGLLSYTTGTNGLSAQLTEEQSAYALRFINPGSEASIERISGEIKALREAGAEYIIVNLHWGTEYADAPSANQKKAAKALCDAGADVIYGLHPHCVQPIETYEVKEESGRTRTAVIAYSLGNFMADQISLNKPGNKTQHGIILNLELERGADGLITATPSYTPSFVHRDIIRMGSLYSYRIVPAGEYALAASRPSLFDSEEKWNLCKEAWTRTQSIAGSAIPAKQK